VQAIVALAIPLDDGGVAEAREKQALVKLEQVQAGRALALRQFSQLFESSLAQARAALRRSHLGRENLAQAETIFKVALARYRAGKARIIEVTDAQNILAVQRLNWLQALADYQLALTQLRYSVALGPEALP